MSGNISRHRQRQYAVQTIYANDINGHLYDKRSVLDNTYIYQNYFLWIKDKKTKLAVNMDSILYAIMLYAEVQENYKKIDIMWISIASRKEVGVDDIDKAILRCAIAEMCFNSIEKIDTAVIIEEYIKIAIMFSSKNAFKFIHKVLDKIKEGIQDNAKEGYK